MHRVLTDENIPYFHFNFIFEFHQILNELYPIYIGKRMHKFIWKFYFPIFLILNFLFIDETNIHCRPLFEFIIHKFFHEFVGIQFT